MWICVQIILFINILQLSLTFIDFCSLPVQESSTWANKLVHILCIYRQARALATALRKRKDDIYVR